MRTPYFRQQTHHTCGPAAIRMVAASFGIKKSEEYFSRLLKTNKNMGTNNQAFSRASKKLGLKYSSKKNATLKNLTRMIKKGYRIIVNYYYPEERLGHYALILKITPSRIFLLDPYVGPRHSYTRMRFYTLWRNGDGKLRHWFAAFKK